MKIDPYNHEQRFHEWLEKVKDGIPKITRANSEIILHYLHDMEHGLNVGRKSTKGGRSYIRLNALKYRLIFFSKRFKKLHGLDKITNISEEQLVLFFSHMRKGKICQEDGRPYKSTGYYVKCFNAFWHWWQKVNQKKGVELPDITTDLDTSGEKPKWVYLTEEQVKQLSDNAKPPYKTLIMFLYDTGIRSPTELVNIRVSDLYEDGKKLYIRDEIAKGGSFGRKINLMICSGMLRHHISSSGLQGDDQVFKICPGATNRYLKRLAKRVLGEATSQAGEKYSQLSMYDFRHCSCCYWLPRYKSESALKYRFGWRKSDKIHYYSELLGMRDTITEEDLLVDVTRTEIEQRLTKTEHENDLLREEITRYNRELEKIKELVYTCTKRLIEIEERQGIVAVYS